MDAITTLLDVIRVRGTVYFTKTVSSPWSMEVDQREDFWRFHLVLTGATWVTVHETGERTLLNAGDFAIVARGKAHVLSDEPGRPVTSLHSIPGSEPSPVANLTDNDPKPRETFMMSGYFSFATGAPIAFLDQLPDIVVARDGSASAPSYLSQLVAIIQCELQNRQSGPVVVLNRLTEILFYHAVRQWVDAEMMPEGALAALADPRLQRALAAIHAKPESNWTVDELARIAGRSRASFANHFRTATGFTPMGYVAYWRSELARRLLSDSDMSLESIANRVGYADSNAFHRAFRRATGASPNKFRRSLKV